MKKKAYVLVYPEGMEPFIKGAAEKAGVPHTTSPVSEDNTIVVNGMEISLANMDIFSDDLDRLRRVAGKITKPSNGKASLRALVCRKPREAVSKLAL